MSNQNPVKANFDQMPLACVLVSGHYQIEYTNAYLENILNPSSIQTCVGISMLDLIAPGDQLVFRNLFKNVEQNPKEQIWVALRLIDSGNTEKKFLFSARRFDNEFGFDRVFFLAGMPFDGSNIENAVNMLDDQQCSDRFTEDKFRSIFQNATIGMAVLKKNGIIEETNPAFVEHIGMARSAVINQFISDVFSSQTTEKLHNLIEILENQQQLFVKDVIRFSLSMDQHRMFEVSLSEIIDDCDQTEKYILFTEDITHQQDTHKALLQSEKLALTGRLAASLAHEINNPLQTSLGCLGLVEEMLDDDDSELAKYIDLAIEELQRSARIVKRLRDLNRPAALSEQSSINLRELIEGALVLTKNHLNDRNIVPVFVYQGPSPIIYASKDQIQQVILNLMMNAIDEMPDGGHIYLDIVPEDDPTGITIKIRDTGNGIKPEIYNNIFDPFFTTKDDGIGLGLYICKQIIESYSGSLNFNSEPGKGTEFTIWLPELGAHDNKERN